LNPMTRKIATAIFPLLIISFSGICHAAGSTIYIKRFESRGGLAASDNAIITLTSVIRDAFRKSGKYHITGDDEVRTALIEGEIEATGAIDRCSDEVCLKELLEAIQTNYIVYGSIRAEGEDSADTLVVTVKMLNRERGSIRLARIKTLRIPVVFRDTLPEGSLALAEYLMNGDLGPVDDYQESILDKSEKLEKKELNNKLQNRKDVVREAVAEKDREFNEELRQKFHKRYPWLRFGYGGFGPMRAFNSEFHDIYGDGQAFFMDLIFKFNGRKNFIYRSTGLVSDFGYRFHYKMFSSDSSKIKSVQEAELNVDPIAESTASIFSFDFLFRIHREKDIRVFKTSINPYIVAAVRAMSFYNEKADMSDSEYADTIYKDTWASTSGDNTIKTFFLRAGVYTGAGVDIAILPGFSLFIEYNIGYTPYGESFVNLEGHQVYAGISFLTSIDYRGTIF